MAGGHSTEVPCLPEMQVGGLLGPPAFSPDPWVPVHTRAFYPVPQGGGPMLGLYTWWGYLLCIYIWDATQMPAKETHHARKHFLPLAFRVVGLASRLTQTH